MLIFPQDQRLVLCLAQRCKTHHRENAFCIWFGRNDPKVGDLVLAQRVQERLASAKGHGS